MADMFGRPWKVVYGGPKRSYNAPRIVDRRGNPVVAFGNQRRWRGQLWADQTAHLIVNAVNQLKSLDVPDSDE